MEWRIRIPAFRFQWLAVAFVLALGAFMALDKTTLHWYVPDTASLEAGLRTESDELRDELDTLESDLRSLRRTVEERDGSADRDLSGIVQAGQITRLIDAVTVLSLVNAYGGFQSTGSAAGRACIAYLTTGLGSFTDCGFQHAEP